MIIWYLHLRNQRFLQVVINSADHVSRSLVVALWGVWEPGSRCCGFVQFGSSRKPDAPFRAPQDRSLWTVKLLLEAQEAKRRSSFWSKDIQNQIRWVTAGTKQLFLASVDVSHFLFVEDCVSDLCHLQNCSARLTCSHCSAFSTSVNLKLNWGFQEKCLKFSWKLKWFLLLLVSQ